MTSNTHNSNAYSVPALLQVAGLNASNQVKRETGALVKVIGTVVKPSAHGEKLYFTLSSGGEKITASIPTTFSVSEGKEICICGTLSFRASRFNTGLDVIIEGLPSDDSLLANHPGGTENETKEPVTLPVKDRFLSIHSFLEVHSISELLFLGSETGLRDVASHIPGSESLRSGIITVSSKKAVLRAMDNYLNEGEYTGIAIARGGDDNTLDIWDEPEFIRAFFLKCEEYDINSYLALGHSHRRLLCENYVDQSFATPTALGDAIAQIQRHANQVRELQGQNVALASQKNRYINSIASLKIVMGVMAVSILILIGLVLLNP